MTISSIFDSPKGESVYHKRTICEVHREIYDLLILNFKNQEITSSIIKLLEEAFILGLKMNSKLIEYKCGNDEWSEDNKNKEEIQIQRNKRIELIKTMQEQKNIIEKYTS